jgi:hypothetical protein
MGLMLRRKEKLSKYSITQIKLYIVLLFRASAASTFLSTPKN